MSRVCGIDLGTQSCRVIIYDAQGRETLAAASAPLELRAGDDGSREQEAQWYQDALDRCFSALDPALRTSVQAVGVSGQQHGLVPLDAAGQAVAPIKLWNDTSTVAECAELTRAAGGTAALLAVTGMPMLPGYTAPKLLWLKKYNPQAFARLRHILLPHDYINFLLSGTYSAEYGDASGTALFDVRSRRWSEAICRLIDPGLIQMLPPLIEAGKPAGRVSAEAAARWGLSEGIPVSSGAGDNMAGAIGTGAVRDGVLTMSLGTSGTLYAYSSSPVIDPQLRLAAFCSSTGGWLPLLCTMNCTVASEQWRSLLSLSVQDFDAAASRAAPGAGGLVMLPFFNGERVPNLPRGRASLQGASAANFNTENIARAALESAIFGMRVGLEAFASQGVPLSEIRLTGGGANSPLWRQIVADICNLPVLVPQEAQSAALGAALQALWCLEGLNAPPNTSEGGHADSAASPAGIQRICDEHVRFNELERAQPNPAAVAQYREAWNSYRAYIDALSPLFT